MKMQERIVWIVVVLSFLVWGITGRRDDHAKSTADLSGEAPTKRAREDSARYTDELGNERRGRKATERKDIESNSLRALRSEEPLTRLSEFLKVLASADAGSFDQISAALSEMKAAGLSLPMEEELMNYRAGQLKGAELMANRTGTSEDFAMMGTLKKQYEGWIQSDPGGAGQWLDALPTGKFRDQMAVAYIAANAKDDPLGSFSLVSSLHPSQQSAAGKAAAERLAESTSADEASALVQTLESNAGGSNSPYLSTLFDTLVSGAGRGDEGFAVSLVESHLDQSFVKGSTLARVSAERAKTDPEGALAWAVSMEGKKADLRHGEIVVSAINGMTVEGLDHAKAWAGTQGDGAAYWLKMIERRQEQLHDRAGEENEYDKDD